MGSPRFIIKWTQPQSPAMRDAAFCQPRGGPNSRSGSNVEGPTSKAQLRGSGMVALGKSLAPMIARTQTDN